MRSRTWTSVLAYTSARILMFGCAVILLYLAGARGVLLLGLGLIISALASYVLLNKQREIIAGKLNGRLSRVGAKASEFRERLEEGSRAEDDEIDGTLTADEPAVTADEPAVTADEPAVAADGTAVAPDEASVTAAAGEQEQPVR